jgi:AraC family transcriptional regulator of adaptative response / DNA-3-methyladenine glycosylase II
LIDEGALDGGDATVGALAARLGIGERHLVRLFTRHCGANPTQIAKTARVQRAKRLLDTTDLPMSQVALVAGFRSLRRFNTVFAEVYHRPPSEIRRGQLAKQHAAVSFSSSSSTANQPECLVRTPSIIAP